MLGCVRPNGIHRLIAAGIQRARQGKCWTQEDLARRLRDGGLPSWRTGTVGTVESGGRSPALAELLVICAVLGVPLADLITDQQASARFSLAAGLDISAWDARTLIAGGPDFCRLSLPAATGAVPSGAERHAARRIGVEAERVREAASALWGRSFDAERDARIPADGMEPRTRQARRGLAARAMTAEIRAWLEAGRLTIPGLRGVREICTLPGAVRYVPLDLNYLPPLAVSPPSPHRDGVPRLVAEEEEAGRQLGAVVPEDPGVPGQGDLEVGAQPRVAGRHAPHDTRRLAGRRKGKPLVTQNAAFRGEPLAGEKRAYVVRDAGAPGRPGKVHETYPYTLHGLLDALDDARFRSFAETAQEVVKVDGQERTVIRRYEGGREVGV